MDKRAGYASTLMWGALRPRTAAIALDRQETYTSIGGYCRKANKSAKLSNRACMLKCVFTVSELTCMYLPYGW